MAGSDDVLVHLVLFLPLCNLFCCRGVVCVVVELLCTAALHSLFERHMLVVLGGLARHKDLHEAKIKAPNHGINTSMKICASCTLMSKYACTPMKMCVG